MKIIIALSTAVIMTFTFGIGVYAENETAGEFVTVDLNSDHAMMTKEDSRALVYSLYEQYRSEALQDPDRISETTCSKYTTRYDNPGEQFDCATISYNGYEMKYGIQVIGETDENGKYPLYIALHGGGETDSAFNDNQWEDMFYYYKYSVKNGIYVNVRGISDTWNLHFMDESYYMYDRLIEDMILFKNADPNRVYIMGFSAGGDGAYQVATHMADRFAAADTSSGHPDGVSPISLADLPILMQVGIADNAYDRNTMAVEYGIRLDDCAEKYGFGYEHEVYIHVPEGHNYEDNDENEDSLQLVVADNDRFLSMVCGDNELSEILSDPNIAYDDDESTYYMVWEAVEETGLETKEADTNAVRWVSRYSRDPYPAQIVWDLDTRASLRTVESFYYLKAPAETKGVLKAAFDKDENAIHIDTSEAEGDFSILFDPLMLDLSEPVKLFVDEKAFLVNIAPSEECIKRSFEETSDVYRAYAAEISYSELIAESVKN